MPALDTAMFLGTLDLKVNSQRVSGGGGEEQGPRDLAEAVLPTPWREEQGPSDLAEAVLPTPWLAGGRRPLPKE